ncbi:MAG: PP2C family protein-serine/threonine phosphatase [Thermoplasmata archaeon]
MWVQAESLRGRDRRVNEDAFMITLESGKDLSEQQGLLAVADGMGGGAFGEVASSLSVTRLNTVFLEEIRSNHNFPEIYDSIFTVLREVNNSIINMAGEKGVPWIGTTLASLLFIGRKGLALNIGDSRVYIVDEGGNIILRTRDHSVAQELVDSGDLSYEELRGDWRRNQLTRALGIDAELEPDSYEMDILPGYSAFICTDGLWENVLDEEIALILPEGSDPIIELMKLALQRGSGDDMTAIAVRFH